MSTKTFKVEQMNFNDGKIRLVDVPYIDLMGDIDYDLNKIYELGQNEFQPKDSPSVSVGDIIHWPNEDKYVVKGMGFEKLTSELYKTLKNSVKESNKGVGLEFRYSVILWNKMGKESFKYC